MRGKLALIKFHSGLNRKEIYEKDFYSYQFLKKYFLIDNDMYTIRSNCGYCINKNCGAYMKYEKPIVFFFLVKKKMAKNFQENIDELLNRRN